MAMSARSEVVSVIRHDVRPGHEPQYEAWTKEVLPIAQGFPGHQGVAIIRPPTGSSTYTIVLHFDTLPHLRGWLESDVRQRLLARVETHLTEPGRVEITPGLEFWLSPPGVKHARPYKQFLLVLAVIYPMTFLMSAVLSPVFAESPGMAMLALRNLINSVTVIALMTWVIMPRVTRAVAGWLYE
jgi:antibiotic biosynthesis monooxygenase (ABM) superfamily enzyme